MALQRPAYTRPQGQSIGRGDSGCPAWREAPVSRRERGGVRGSRLGANPGGAAVGADLGGSSKYSGETPED